MNNAFLDLIEMVGTGKKLFSQMVIRHHHLVSCSFPDRDPYNGL